MSEPLVLDASAAIAIARGEPAAGAVQRVVHDQRAADGRTVVPGHFWLELANVLLRRYRMDPGPLAEMIRELDVVAIETVEIDRPLLLLTLDRMAVHGLSAYEAAYLALAEAVDGRLLTLDERLAEAAGDRAVPLEGAAPTRLAERRAPYRPGPGLGAVPGFGAYLAEVRRRADASA
jgi:predicted nucleic acid-binding protein